MKKVNAKETAKTIVLVGVGISAEVVTGIALLAAGSAIENPVGKVLWKIGSVAASRGVGYATGEYVDATFDMVEEIVSKGKEKLKEFEESKKKEKNNGPIEVEFEVKTA